MAVFGALVGDGAVGPARRSAAIDSAAAADGGGGFGVRRGEAKLRAVLGDGAKWIWNAASEALPGCVEIVARSPPLAVAA